MIWVFGDSFSTNESADSWGKRLALRLNQDIKIHSFNGVSEYRILKTIENFISQIELCDIVVVCHTNPYRVFIPDNVIYPARRLASHPHCDLVISDVDQRGFFWRLISRFYFKYFFDEIYHKTIHELLIDRISNLVRTRTVNLIDISGFATNVHIYSFHDIFLSNHGTINHMTIDGNEQVAAHLLELIDAKFYQNTI